MSNKRKAVLSQVQDEHREHKGLRGPQRKDGFFRFGERKVGGSAKGQNCCDSASAVVADTLIFFFSVALRVLRVLCVRLVYSPEFVDFQNRNG
jgi:hypothetical protein